MGWRRVHSFIAWFALIVGGLGIALAVFLLVQVWDHSRLRSPANLGNERAAALLSERDLPSDLVEFAVVGDINNGTETFEAIIARLRDEKEVAFLVLLGDCAADPNRQLHGYFIHEFAETGFALPTFIVAGNHDVAPGRFSYAEFEGLYGPANFAFSYHEHLFIGLGGIHDREECRETVSFLEKTLRERRSQAKRVFVFMHCAPLASEDIPTDRMTYSREFQDLFEKYRVNYVLSGHHHRLARTEVNGVAYLVTGGGGARLRSDRFEDIGLFHHLTLIKMRGNSIAEYIIPIAPAHSVFRVMERIERWGLTVLWPQHPVMGGMAAVVVVGAFIWGVVDRRRQSKPCAKRGPPTSDCSQTPVGSG